MRLPDLPPGRWRHFRGGLYEVIGQALDCNDEPRKVVVYRPLYDAGGEEKYFVRSVEDWFSSVCLDCDGRSTVLPNYPGIPKCQTDWDHHIIKRFEYVGPIED